MSSDLPSPVRPVVLPAPPLQALREHWLLFLILGAAVMLVGCLAIGSSFIATIATVELLGTFLLLGGVLHLVNAITGRVWNGFFVHLLIGVLYVVVGMLMMNHPVQAAAGLTLMLAAAYIVGGILRIIVAALEHFHGWAWVFANGLVSLFLGIFIWRHFPEASLWVIGVLVGVDLIFSGWSWVILALAVRSQPPAVA